MRNSAVAAFFCAPAVACAADGKGGEGGSMAAAVFQMTASLAIVVGIIYLLYYVFNRWFKGMTGGKARTGHIRVVETRYLAPKRSLMIVEVGGEYLLLGNGSEGVQLIKKLENEGELAAQSAASPLQPVPELFRKTFDDTLRKLKEGFAGPRNNDVAMKRRLTPSCNAEPMTVGEMLEQMQPK